MSLVVAVVAIVVLVASYLTWLAGRLDRVAVRVEAAADALDAQLVRRAALAYELAAKPQYASLRNAARASLDTQTQGPERWAIESELSRALRAAPDVAAAPDMSVNARKVMLARQFHNDAVRDLLALRRRWLIRTLHLYGRAQPPQYAEFDAEDRAG